MVCVFTFRISERSPTESHQHQQALQKMQQDKMQPVVNKVRNAINNVGKTGGFTYIFEDGVASFIPGANVEDVTAKVQAEIAKMK